MTASRNVVQLSTQRRRRGLSRRNPDEPVYIFVMSTTRNRRLMSGIADQMLQREDADEFLAFHLQVEQWRLQELEMPEDQITAELAAISRTVRAIVWTIRRAQA